MGRAAESKKALLAEIKDLRDRLAETEEALLTAAESRNNPVQKEVENKTRWAKHCDDERARPTDLLQIEHPVHHHLREDLEKTRKELRECSLKLLLAEETERKRIAQEIHDGISQLWATVKIRTENILMNLDKEIATPLKDILVIIDLGMEETRRIQMNLRPALLDNLGILAALSWFCEQFRKAHPAIGVETEIDIEERDISNPVKTVIFRVLQEAFNNISKHSRTSLVNLSLHGKGGRVELTIQDHGQGFNLDEFLSLTSSKKGLGLSGMKERIHLSDGSFSIESTRGKGTIIRASWPLAEH